MAEELEMAAEEVSGAPSELVKGASRSLEDITVRELMALPTKPARPAFMAVPKVPATREELEELKEAAEEAEPEPEEPAEARAAEDTTSVDADVEAEELEAPEGETAAGPQAAAPPQCGSFEGLPQTAWNPPDPTIAVGAGRVLIAVNTDLAGYSKSGDFLFRWPDMTTLFSPVLPRDAKIFDPVLAYDHYEDRWIVVIAARRDSPRGSWFMVGVSQESDPAGPYWVWALDANLNGSTPTDNWADYPMLGFDTQAIYITANMFKFGGSFQYAKLRVLYKAELYAGGSIRWYDWWNLKNPDGSVAFTVQPATHYRGTGGDPPAYFINALWPKGDSLTLRTLRSPVAFWRGGSAQWGKVGVSCRSYDFPPDARQPGTGARIDTLDPRLMRAIYQYVDGVKRIWTAHTTKHTWSGDSEARSAVQWYEIDVPTQKVVQQNRYGARGKYYFFPAIQTDLSRNAYLVFARAGEEEHGQLRHTGRRVSAAPDDLENSRLIKSGESSNTGGRWGDYFGICRDGDDSSKVWMYGEYADRDNTWGTWVACATYD